MDPRATRVSVHPAFNAYYYSFYLEGLARHFGTPLTFNLEGFPTIGQYSRDCFAFEVAPSGLKVCIDARDGTFLDPEYLAWADSYGKVNADFDGIPSLPCLNGADLQAKARRMVPIGPSFGTRWLGFMGAAVKVFQTAAAGGDAIGPWREHVGNYWRQYQLRLPESFYVPGQSDSSYVFYVASLWRREPECNELRAVFIRACRGTPGLAFEGGFVPRAQGSVAGFDDCATPLRYSLADYVAKMRRSAVAFNTPAVDSCLGWKLGEFLALGKAIVSTPLRRALPAPLVHGEQIHYVSGTPESIRDAVMNICRDDAYRRRLEKGARDYYCQFLSPARVIESLVERSDVR